VTQNEAGSTNTQPDESDYAVVRPLDVASDDNDDVNGDYAYPTAASVPADSSNRPYLDLLAEPDDPLQLTVVFTRPETENTTSVSGAYDDVIKIATEDNEVFSNDAVDSAANEQQPATYIEIIWVVGTLLL